MGVVDVTGSSSKGDLHWLYKLALQIEIIKLEFRLQSVIIDGRDTDLFITQELNSTLRVWRERTCKHRQGRSHKMLPSLLKDVKRRHLHAFITTMRAAAERDTSRRSHTWPTFTTFAYS